MVKEFVLGALVIVLRPRLEEWLIRSAKECGLSLSDFNLPTEAKALHKVITHKQPEFQKFLEALEPKSLRFQRLKAYLTE
jgi:hypothetical protein